MCGDMYDSSCNDLTLKDYIWIFIIGSCCIFTGIWFCWFQGLACFKGTGKGCKRERCASLIPCLCRGNNHAYAAAPAPAAAPAAPVIVQIHNNNGGGSGSDDDGSDEEKKKKKDKKESDVEGTN